MIVQSKLLMIVTEYDRKQSTKKHYNRYALAQYCDSIDRVMEERDRGSPLALALQAGFCGSLLRHIARKLKLDHEYPEHA
jgi:hypothetical protein